MGIAPLFSLEDEDLDEIVAPLQKTVDELDRKKTDAGATGERRSGGAQPKFNKCMSLFGAT